MCGDLNAIDHSATFTNLPQVTSFTICYTRGEGGDSTMSLYLNGAHNQDVTFASTGGWGGSIDDYVTQTIYINIPQGSSIKFQCDKDGTTYDYPINIDYIEVLSTGPMPTPGPTATPTVIPWGANLIQNPGFETGTTVNWSGLAETEVANGTSTSGQYSLFVYNQDTSLSIKQEIRNIQPYTNYTISWYSKSDDPNAYAEISVKPNDSYFLCATSYTVSDYWTKSEISFNSEYFDTISIIISTSRSSSIYYDDFSLTSDGIQTTPSATATPTPTPMATATTVPTQTPGPSSSIRYEAENGQTNASIENWDFASNQYQIGMFNSVGKYVTILLPANSFPYLLAN